MAVSSWRVQLTEDEVTFVHRSRIFTHISHLLAKLDNARRESSAALTPLVGWIEAC